MNRIISILLVAVLTLTLFAACKPEPVEPDPEKLATPQNVKVNESGMITWDAVENATSYVVTAGSNTYETKETSCGVSSAEDFTCTVVAKAEGYLDSDPSAPVKFTAERDPIVDVPKTAVAIDGRSTIRTGHKITLKATVSGIDDQTVMWSVTDGGEYVSIDPISGELTAVSGLLGDKIIKVTATSLADESVIGEKVITVVTRPELTQEMLDEVASQKALGFDGYVNISLYNYGSISNDLYMTSVSNLKTSLNGENWYAQYYDATTGLFQDLYYKNVNGVASQIGVSFLNDEEYFPMLDDEGRTVSWDASGLYNNFEGVMVTDFVFDEESWRYKYVGSDPTFMQRVVSSANPYDFVPESLSLILDEGMILGIYAVSKDDYTIAGGYRAVQELTVALNWGDTVDVPTIGKFKHEDIHDPLNEAIANMQKLNSYTLTYTETSGGIYSSGYNVTGFTETITANDCYFDPYNVRYDVSGEEIIEYTSSPYGYHKINDQLYNAFYTGEDGNPLASRAYAKDFSAAKPTFAFAGEIFTSYYEDEDEGTITYYVNDIMSSVASTFYYGVGNDIQMYGLFAMEGYTSDGDTFTPYVVIKDGYIIESGFYYNISYIYGIVEIKYADFNTAALPEDANVEFETRQVPDSWDDVTITTSGDSHYEDNTELNAVDYLKTLLSMTEEEVHEYVPFFGNAIGDTYGFGLTQIYIPAGTGHSQMAVVFYYDVPLDVDYSINSSMEAVRSYLVECGFHKMANGDYTNGRVSVAVVDSSLDFNIYVWKA